MPKGKETLDPRENPMLRSGFESFLNQVIRKALQVSQGNLMQRFISHEGPKMFQIRSIGSLGVGASSMEPEMEEMKIVLGLMRHGINFHGLRPIFRMHDNTIYHAFIGTTFRHE
jgi:hypothetical protein